MNMNAEEPEWLRYTALGMNDLSCCLDFSPDGKFLATGYADSKVRIISIKHKKLSE